MMKPSLLATVDFHGHALKMLERDGEPFVAMRELVEAIGLDWSPQFRKLASDTCWHGCHMATETPAGPRETLCMPLRKLPGWLMSVAPRKVAVAVRPTLELFQAECDDVLWRYWNEKGAMRGRALYPPLPVPIPPEPETITITRARYIELLEIENAHLRGGPKRKRRPTTPEEKAAIVEMRRGGMSLSQIEKRTGVSHGAIVYICTAAGIKVAA